MYKEMRACNIPPSGKSVETLNSITNSLNTLNPNTEAEQRDISCFSFG
jgi:hypothetical protein